MKKSKIIFLSIINAIIMMVLTYFLQLQPYLFKDESLVIQGGQFCKEILFGLTDRPESDRFLFINTSFSNYLLTVRDQYDFELGNQVITDRYQLSELFTKLKKRNQHQFVIVDILFTDSSPEDSLLQASIMGLNGIIVASYNKNSVEVPPIFDVNHGLVSIKTLDDVFLKYDLVQYDSIKTIPLKVFEDILGKEIQREMIAYSFDGRWVMDYFIPQLRIRNYDLLEAKNYSLVNLSEIYTLEVEALNELSHGRILVIGDFSGNDSFQTLLGEISGPLILTNTLLALEYGDNRITWKYLMYLLAAYTSISFLLFYPDDRIEVTINRINAPIWVQKLVLGGSFFLMLALISLFGYVVFDKILNIFFVSLYLYIVDKIRKIKVASGHSK